MLEIYCGDGKGKTTASVGLSVRAAGHGIPVLFVQFLKDGSSGEISVLKHIPRIQVWHPPVFYGFVRKMSEEQKQETRYSYARLLEEIKEEIHRLPGKPMVVVLDEVIHACNFGLLEEKDLYGLLDTCPQETEVVLTGRNPSEELKKRADYISEIQKIKHPYDEGIPARKGIEL